jgi:hypothetical protein
MSFQLCISKDKTVYYYWTHNWKIYAKKWGWNVENDWLNNTVENAKTNLRNVIKRLTYVGIKSFPDDDWRVTEYNFLRDLEILLQYTEKFNSADICTGKLVVY